MKVPEVQGGQLEVRGVYREDSWTSQSVQGGQLDVPEVCEGGQRDVPWSVQPVKLHFQRVQEE